MLRFMVATILAGVTIMTSAQENYNLELLAQEPFFEEASDIWGYVDKNGVEYAVVGGFEGTYIYSLEVPEAPKQRAYIEGAASIWRDFKSFGDYIYGVAYRGNDGLLVIDMSNAPLVISHSFHTPFVTDISLAGDTIVNGTYTKAHNIFIDDRGYIFLSDCPGFYRGIAVFEIGDLPETPSYVTVFNNNLSHDIVVQNNLAYSSDVFAGEFSIWDVSNIQAPALIATQPTGSRFTHNSWISDDGQYLFTTDERAGAFIESYDVSDPQDIRFLDRIQVVDAAVRQVIPHNTHYLDGFLYTSYYVDGLVIYDASRPENMVEVARYDTYLEGGTGFHGCWGAYPYLPSGTIIASDIEGGLFVFNGQFERAAWLEGTITDAISGSPLPDVKITIQDERNETLISSFNGEYKTGRGIGGTYTIEYYHPLYKVITKEIELVNGEVLVEDAVMEPLNSISFSGQVVDATDGKPVGESQIIFQNRDLILETRSDVQGFYSLNGYPGQFEILVGSWGYETQAISQSINDDYIGNVELMPGYRDDFVLDLGWTVTSINVNAGEWLRAKPYPTFNGDAPVNPGMDIEGDLGEFCYVTGNSGPGQGVGSQDLDDGTTFLTSPPIDLSGVNQPVLRNFIWFYASGRTDRDVFRNDTLYIQLIQQGDTLVLDTIVDDTEGWELREYSLEGLFDPNFPFRIQYAVADLPGPQQGNLVEAGIDGFEILGNFSVSVQDQLLDDQDWSVNPNPFTDRLMISLDSEDGLSQSNRFMLFNHLGQVVLNRPIRTLEFIDVHNIPSGIYFGVLSRDGVTTTAKKLVKN